MKDQLDTLYKDSYDTEKLPRVKYEDLPRTLKEEVRDRFTPENISDFLHKLYEQDDYDELFSSFSDDEQRKIFTRLRNIATYTIDYEIEYIPADKLTVDHPDCEIRHITPYLYAADAYIAVGNTLADISQRAKASHKKKSSLAKASRNLNLASNGPYQISPSDKNYQYALTLKKNKFAYIIQLDSEYFDQLDIEKGSINYDGIDMEELLGHSLATRSDIERFDPSLLMQIYTAVVNEVAEGNNSMTISFYLPDFCKNMGIKYLNQNDAAYNIIEKIKVFYNCVGIFPGKSISAVCIPIDFDMETNVITIAVPYLLRIRNALIEANERESLRKTGPKTYINPHHNMLIKSTYNKSRNKPAKELLNVITNGMLNRGWDPDWKTREWRSACTAKNFDPDRITYHKKFGDIIKSCPGLRSRLEACSTTGSKNRCIENAFRGFYDLLENETYVREFFVDLKYERIIPKMSTLKDSFRISFTGKNPDYQRISQ